MTKILMTIAIAALLTACSTHVQTTSGADYLARYDADAAATKQIGKQRAPGRETARAKSARLDPAIRAAANVEPILRFPARIGLARIAGGRLTAIPAKEATLWQKLANRHRTLGTFAAVDPLVAHYTAKSLGHSSGAPDVGAIVETIRLGAARQHLDAVLIYEVGARGGAETTGLAFMDLTVIGGAILPTRSIEVEGVAKALLLDVRNGYPYGSASTSVDLSKLSPSWGSDARAEDMRREALIKVTGSLMPEVETMFRDLILEMNARAARR